ncbi:MAG TPA: 2-oxoglutarate and iron-dependent oxygenase domain-containing protein [Candidatus Babeliales bacterium]|jgi:isopenicillin N synthase-like dioxygenase|nr:2-oxoglutarate and iron-dependent oxygenase domain-containing protein [Candidatus Babeliales bacterium]
MLQIFLSTLLIVGSFINTKAEEVLILDIISYDKLMQEDSETLQILHTALHEKGIVGVRGIPHYQEKYEQFIKAAREFSRLPEETKEKYKPDRSLGETFLGYEMGKEKFQRPNGDWVIDDLKTSYYAFVPDNLQNKWPLETDLRTPFQNLGKLMAEIGELIMYKIDLLGDITGFQLEDDSRVGRMLYYKKSDNNENPYWCGAHFDHSLFTVILPAVYFVEEEQIPEPEEAGLFIRTSQEMPFKKVFVDDPDVMMFQVGEFGQLATDDTIRATEHLVQKAIGTVERYTLALFHNAPMDVPICSKSVLTNDARYGAKTGESSTFRHWQEATFQRFLVKQDS